MTELTKKLKEIQENFNKFIEIKKEVSLGTNLKIYDVSHLCYDKEELIEKLIAEYKERDLKEIVEEESMDYVFQFYCDIRFEEFKEELKEQFDVDFGEVIWLGRTSTFKMINNELYEMAYNHNELTIVLDRLDFDLDKKIKLTYKDIKNWISEFGKEDIKKYIDMYVSESKTLIEEIDKWKKAKDYLEEYKKNQEKDFMEFFFYNICDEKLYKIKKERQRGYDKKVSKAIAVRTKHKRQTKNTKLIVKVG